METRVGKFVPDEAAKPAVVVESKKAETKAPEPDPTVTPVTVATDTVDVSLTGPATVGAGDFVIVAIATATAGADLTFSYDPDPGAAKRAVFEEPGTGRRLIVFIQPPPAKYRIALIGQITTAGKDPVDVAVHDVAVGTVPPPPVPPGPGPNPPTAFEQTIRAAYAAEPAADKARSVAALASLYRTASTSTVQDPTVTTYAQLFADMKIASRALLSETAIPGVRHVIGERLNAEFSTANESIDRAKAAAEFMVVATALEGLR